MVEKVVVTKHLSEEMMTAGRHLITNLDQAEVPVKGALWLYNPESEMWKLVIALPEVNAKGSRRAYQRIQLVLFELSKGQPTIGLEDITVKDVDDPSIKPLIIENSRVPTLTGRRVSRSSINGVFLEDAYIYRLDQGSP